jgi:hypothetical protein
MNQHPQFGTRLVRRCRKIRRVCSDVISEIGHGGRRRFHGLAQQGRRA